MPDKNHPLSAFNQYFDQIYVLTLPHTVERQQSIKTLFDGLNWRFFYGIDKNELTRDPLQLQDIYDDVAHRRIKRTYRSMSPGEIACALSHRQIYQDALDNNYQRIAIFEDDAMPCYEQLTDFANKIAQLPDNWDLVMLGYYGEKRPGLKASTQRKLYGLFHHLHWFNWHKVNKKWLDRLCMQDYSADFYTIGKVLGAHAYAINLATAKAFIEFDTPVKVQADRIFNYYLAENELLAFAPKQPFFTLSELSKVSSIQKQA